MIFDIHNPPIEGKATFDCSCGLLFCQALGWFDKYLSMQEFFEAEPIIIVKEYDDRDTCAIIIDDNKMLQKEIALSMDRLGFIIVNKVVGVGRKTYNYVHLRKKK